MSNLNRKNAGLEQRRGTITKTVAIPAMIAKGYIREDDLSTALRPFIEQKLGRPLAPGSEVEVEVITGDYLEDFQGLRFEAREPIHADSDRGDDVG